MSVPARFADLDFYQVLGIEKTATQAEITKAYRRVALRCHPDVNHSPTATIEFQHLARVHETLSDPVKRRRYDARGDVEDEDGGIGDGATFDEAYAHWRSVFPSISRADIDAYRTKYIDSQEELEDLIEAYEKYDGDLAIIAECVPFADADSIPRLAQRLRTSSVHASYTKKYVDGIVRKLRKTEASEAAEAEEAAKQLNPKERKLLMSSSSSSTSSLATLIQQRQSARASALDALAAKYQAQAEEDGEEMETSEPSEEEFARLQREIVSRGKQSTSTSRSRNTSASASTRRTNTRSQPSRTATKVLGGHSSRTSRNRRNKENIDSSNE